MKNILLILLLLIGFNSRGQNKNIVLGYNHLTPSFKGSHTISDGVLILTNPSDSGNVAIAYNAGHNMTTGSNNFCIGYMVCKNMTTGSYNTIIVDSADISIQNINSDLNFIVDYDCRYLKDRPELKGYLKAFEDFGMGNIMYMSSCQTRKRFHEKLKYYIHYHN